MLTCAVELPAPVRFAVAIATVFRKSHVEKTEEDFRKEWRDLNESAGSGVFAQIMEPHYFSFTKDSSLIPIMPMRIEWSDATHAQTTKKAQRSHIRFDVKVYYSLGTRIDLVIRAKRSDKLDQAMSWKIEKIFLWINHRWDSENIFSDPQQVAARFIEIGLDPRLVDGYEEPEQASV